MDKIGDKENVWMKLGWGRLRPKKSGTFLEDCAEILWARIARFPE